jgi:hypothetical protein
MSHAEQIPMQRLSAAAKLQASRERNRPGPLNPECVTDRCRCGSIYTKKPGASSRRKLMIKSRRIMTPVRGIEQPPPES